MFRDIQAVTRAGLHANEDAVGAGKDFLFVVDGATGLSHRNYMDPRSDARWFAGQTARLLQELLPDRHLSLSDILHTAMDIWPPLLAVTVIRIPRAARSRIRGPAHGGHCRLARPGG